MLSILNDGPFLHALGWLGGPERNVQVRAAGAFADLVPQWSFETGSVAATAPMERAAMLAPLAPAVLKASGVARARSAARSTVFCALLAKELVKTISDRPGYHGNRTGVGIVSATAIAQVCWKFESVGVSDDWDNTDTMLLPASIPSGVATATSAVIGTHATAVALGDGVGGMLSAIEMAHLGFLHDRMDHMLAIAAEEGSEAMFIALDAQGIKRPIADGAAGFVLGREPAPGAGAQWQFALIGSTHGTQAQALPADWADADRIRIETGDRFLCYTGNLVPAALLAATKSASPRVVLEIVITGAAVYTFGLRKHIN